MIRDPSVLVGLLVGAALGVLVLEQVIRRTVLGVALVLVVVLVEAVGITLEATIGGFRIEPGDLVAALLGAAAVARIARSRALTGSQALVLVYGVLVLLAVAKGIPHFGVGAAVNEARKFIRFGAAALYASTVDPTVPLRDRFGMVWVRVGVALIVLCVVRWAAFFGGVSLPFADPDDLRVIVSSEALVLLTAMILAAGAAAVSRPASTWRPPSTLAPSATRRLPTFAAVALVSVVLLQHRVLWVGLVVALVLLVARDPGSSARLLGRLAVAGAAILVLAFAALGQGQEVVTDRLSESAQSVDTFEWRVAGWEELIEDQAPEGPEGWIAGQRFGRGYSRFVGGTRFDVTPHNFYLESFLRIGLAGAGILTVLHVWAIARLLPSRAGSALVRDDVLAVVLVVVLLFYGTSHGQMEQGLLLGVALAAARDRARASPPWRPGTGRGRPVEVSRTARRPVTSHRT